MKKLIISLILFFAGLSCGIFISDNLINKKKSNELILQEAGEEISLDFASDSDYKKIQFFSHYYIESTKDSIVIYHQ